jgi:hypothetical protein
MSITLLDSDFAKQKLRSATVLLDALLPGDWPYSDAQEAAQLIRTEFDEELKKLDALDDDSDPAIRVAHCVQARHVIQKNKGYIGFILRSSNVRNSVELYHPLKTITASLLGPKYRLIIGSEWNYSPYIYPLLSQLLDSFILVGLPASEAQNALLVPTAGHELGHAIWRDTNVHQKFGALIESKIIEAYQHRWSSTERFFPSAVKSSDIATDLEARAVWSASYKYAARQLEEVFCDCVGVWLFGEGYLHAFRYLLAPDSAARPSDYYPPNRRRAEYSVRAASEYGDRIHLHYPDVFRPPEASTDLKLEIADSVTHDLAPIAISEAASFLGSKPLSRPTAAATQKCEQSLRALRPPSEYGSIADVVNAAWNVRQSIENWDIPGVKNNRKIDVLNDLVFKSFEVMEWLSLPRVGA